MVDVIIMIIIIIIINNNQGREGRAGQGRAAVLHCMKV